MISLSIQKGYNIRIQGAPALELETFAPPTHVALLPERIRFAKPRLKVGVGDRVDVGSALIEDKRNTDIRYLSPGGGTIAEINYGSRRVIREIVIELDADESFEAFGAISEDELQQVDRQTVVDAIIKGGLWPLIREFPYRDMARSHVVPPAVFVNLGSLEPFQPQPEIYLKGKKALVEYGVNVLKRLTGGDVIVSAHQSDHRALKDYAQLITHVYTGSYPAHDPGVLLYRTKTSAEENHAWFVDGQDLLLLAELLKSGRFPTERVVVVCGSSVQTRKHIKTRIGVPFSHILKGSAVEKDACYVAGGVLTGYYSSESSYMGFFEKSLMVMPEGFGKGEFFDWAMPGYEKPSYSRTFLSAVNKTALPADGNRHGGLRACVSCNHCPKVCPVDILPQLTYKAILAGEVEEALAHGLLDCVECGLCSYVCPSKLELTRTLQKAKEDYYKEVV